MDSPEPTSLPLVFESGRFRFEEDGTLHVHLQHSDADPHPLVTHPEGDETQVPPSAGSAELRGNGKGAGRGHFRRSEEPAPQGFVLTLRGYEFVQVEGSGDVSVLIKVGALPSWFAAGKVHRFARPGAPSPTLTPDSAEPPQPEVKAAWAPPKDAGPIPTAAPRAARGGCLALLLLGFSALVMGVAACSGPTPPPVAIPDDDDAVDDDDDSGSDDDDDTGDDDTGDDDTGDDDSASDDDDTGDDDDTTPQTIGDLCFPEINDATVPGPDYDQYSPVVGSHCFGTNHQTIAGIERVVFLGDSVTVGVPNLLLDLSSWGFPAGAGTPETAFYRNLLADQLAIEFGLTAPGLLWRNADLLNGTTITQEDGDFASCAKWGARNDDLLLPPRMQLESCIPPAERSKNTLIIMTSGSNDLANMTGNAIAGADAAALEAQAAQLVADFEDAITWIKAPGRFPNGVSVIYGNMYEFTDGTGDTSACPAAAFAGFGTPPPDPDTLAEVVIGIQEEYMRIAVANGVDMIWMLEHFCGHGWKHDDPSARCYRGPGADLWFDLSCTHPNEAGHQQLAAMFMAVVQE